MTAIRLLDSCSITLFHVVGGPRRLDPLPPSGGVVDRAPQDTAIKKGESTFRRISSVSWAPTSGVRHGLWMPEEWRAACMRPRKMGFTGFQPMAAAAMVSGHPREEPARLSARKQKQKDFFLSKTTIPEACKNQRRQLKGMKEVAHSAWMTMGKCCCCCCCCCRCPYMRMKR